jgi:CDP-diacylglycerol--serine O-phosphatidyltransferase
MAQKVVSDGSRAGFSGRFGMQISGDASFQHGLRLTDVCAILQISFGVAPAVAAFAIGIRTIADHLFLSFFVLCGLTRLARFNVTAAVLPKDKSGKSHYFEGTPIPTSLSIASLMAYWVSQGWIHENLPLGTVLKDTVFEFHPVVLLFALWGCLMVSKTLRIPKP